MATLFPELLWHLLPFRLILGLPDLTLFKNSSLYTEVLRPFSECWSHLEEFMEEILHTEALKDG